MPKHKDIKKPFYHYPLLWREPAEKRIRFPSQVRYVDEEKREEEEEEEKEKKEETEPKKKRGRKKKEPRKVVVEDDNIVKWIVENFHNRGTI